MPTSKNNRTFDVEYWKMKKIQTTELCYADDMLIAMKLMKNLQHNCEILDEKLKN